MGDISFTLGEKVNYLLKRHFDLPTTTAEIPFHQEPVSDSKSKNIYENQIFSDAIPTEVPIQLNQIDTPDANSPYKVNARDVIAPNRLNAMSAAAIDAIEIYSIPGIPIAKVIDLPLEAKNETTFFNRILQDIIPRSTHASYDYIVKDVDGNEITPSFGDWILDSDTGFITFYSIDSIPDSITLDQFSALPRITAYIYTGRKGLIGNISHIDGINLGNSNNFSDISENSSFLWNSTTQNFEPQNVWSLHINPTNAAEQQAKQDNTVYKPDGKVVIGSNIARSGLDICGDEIHYTLDVSGSIGCTQQIHCEELLTRSDKTTKENILDLSQEHVEDVFDKLRPVEFTWKKAPTKGKQFGFIAQELEEIVPEVVRQDGSGLKGVMYERFVPFLTKMVQVQQQKIVELEERLDELTRTSSS